MLSEDEIAAIMANVESALADYVPDGDDIVFEASGNNVTARR